MKEEYLKTNEEGIEFFRLDQEYELRLSQEEGEKNLAKIAKKYEKEYVWAFDSETSTWFHYPVIKQVEKINRRKGSARIEATIPSQLKRPPGASSFIYHTHPDAVTYKLLEKPKKGWHSAEFLHASSQIPKKEDIEAAAKLIGNGYKDFRIATPRGITIIRFYREKMEEPEQTIKGFNIPQEGMYEALEESYESSVKFAFEYMNKRYGGVFTFEFQALE